MAEDLHTLSAPYALDALDPEDRARFEQHLANCEQCRADLASLADAASSLAFAVEGPPPPEALRGRILEAARAEGAANVRQLRRRPRKGADAFAAIAAVAAIAIVAFGVWDVVHHSSTTSAQRVLQDPKARHYQVPGGHGQLVVAPSGDAALALDLPKPPAGKTYEAWVAEPSVRAAGTFDGRVEKLPLRVRHGAKVMVTLERAGGVDAPTTKPLFVVHV
jgi:anti-sigma factor RsiW